MSLYVPPVERLAKRPRLYLLSGISALFAITALVFGLSTSLVATTSPATACESGCGDNGGQDAGEENGENGNYNGNGDNCGGCGDDNGDDNGGNGDNGNGGNDDECGGCSDEGDDTGENGNTASREPDEPWWERDHSIAVNSNRNRMGRPALFGMRRTLTRQRVVYAQPRQRVIYVEPRRTRIIRPRIVRQARPVYRTRLATRGLRYPTVIYTAPAIPYSPPAARRIIYTSGHGYEAAGYGAYGYRHGSGDIEAYAARGRVGVRAKRVVRTARGRVMVKSVSAYAEGRHARVRISGHKVIARGSATRIYGALPRRGYASESYIYADDRGADILTTTSRQYKVMMRGRYR